MRCKVGISFLLQEDIALMAKERALLLEEVK